MPEPSWRKLNPICKRLLMDLSLKNRVEDKMIYGTDDDSSTSFEFLRFLLVSKAFLNISQRNAIYCLYIQGDSRTIKSWNLLFSRNSVFDKKSDSYAFESYHRYISLFFNLSFNSAKFLVSLLDPGHLCIYLNDTYYSDEKLEECASLFGGSTGEKGLILSGAVGNHCSKLVNKLSPSLKRMCCPIKFLSNPDLLPLKLDLFRTQNCIKGINGLNQIFEHDVKEIKTIYDDYVSDQPEDQIYKRKELEARFPGSLESIDLTFQNCTSSMDQLLEFIKDLKNYFPNLRFIHLRKVYLGKFHTHSEQEIINPVLRAHEKLLEMKDFCKSARIKMCIDAYSFIFYRPKIKPLFDCDWLNLVTKDGSFQIKEHNHDKSRFTTNTNAHCTVDFLLEDNNFKAINHVPIDHYPNF